MSVHTAAMTERARQVYHRAPLRVAKRRRRDDRTAVPAETGRQGDVPPVPPT